MFIKRIYLFFIILTIFLSRFSYDKISTIKNLPLFEISMSLDEFKDFIFKNFPLDDENKLLFNYNFTNYHFFFKKNNPQNFYYSNENIKFMLKKSFSYTNFSKLQVQLNKVFSYLICDDCKTTGSSTFGEFKELMYQEDHQKAFISTNNFFRKPIYYVLSIPIEKLNKVLKKSYISFFDKKIFRIVYQLQLSLDEFSFLKEHLKQKYILHQNQDENQDQYQDFLKYESKDQQKSIFLSKYIQDDSKYFLYYYDNTLSASYKTYLDEVEKNLDQLIELNQFYFLYNF